MVPLSGVNGTSVRRKWWVAVPAGRVARVAGQVAANTGRVAMVAGAVSGQPQLYAAGATAQRAGVTVRAV